jgi:hypothetical protein
MVVRVPECALRLTELMLTHACSRGMEATAGLARGSPVAAQMLRALLVCSASDCRCASSVERVCAEWRAADVSLFDVGLPCSAVRDAAVACLCAGFDVLWSTVEEQATWLVNVVVASRSGTSCRVRTLDAAGC